MVAVRRPSARKARSAPPDLTVVAIPVFFGAMALEYVVLRRRAAARGSSSAGDFERRDTVASLTMGTASLAAPFVLPRLLRPFTPGRGRLGKLLVAGAVGAAAAATAADAVVRSATRDLPAPSAGSDRDGWNGEGGGSDPAERSDHGPGGRSIEVGAEPLALRRARRVAAVGGVVAVVAGGVAVTTTWWSHLTPERLWKHRLHRGLGGPLAVGLAVLGWDFIYYWNHRFSHESRYMWAMHVVHHSSERYNLSTALRQPVADALATSIPYGALCLFGISPELVETARGVNLLYQFWIHTETIGTLGPPEAVLNTPSHHRVHHGSNRKYLDRNHGSILILWDRLFGTFEPEGEQVVYGLTKDIKTFNPVTIAGHEYVAMLRDVAAAAGWGERISYVVRGPGWRPGRGRAGGPVPVAADSGEVPGPLDLVPA